MRNNEPQSKAATVEFERGLDHNDVTEVELTGCQDQGGGRAHCRFCGLGTRRALVPSPAIIMNSSAFC